jgi:hypothetical protein
VSHSQCHCETALSSQSSCHASQPCGPCLHNVLLMAGFCSIYSVNLCAAPQCEISWSQQPAPSGRLAAAASVHARREPLGGSKRQSDENSHSNVSHKDALAGSSQRSATRITPFAGASQRYNVHYYMKRAHAYIAACIRPPPIKP